MVALAATVLPGCGTSAPPTPPPAEPHTAFGPVEIKVGGDPDWLVAGFGSVWLKRPDGRVDRIDPATAKILTEIPTENSALPEDCGGIGLGPDAIWSCSSEAVVRIDPGTDKVVASVPAGKVPSQGRLVRAAGRIWVLAGNGDQLVGIGETDGALSDPIALPAACHDLGATADIVYAVCERADRVLRIDPATAKVTAETTITKPVWVSAAASGVWVAAEQSLLRLDASSLSTVSTLPGVTTGNLGAIWADDSGVWVHRMDPFLTHVSAAAGSVSRVISAPYASGGDVLVDGSYLWTTDFDARLVIRMDLSASR
jgi:hypothetical protein